LIIAKILRAEQKDNVSKDDEDIEDEFEEDLEDDLEDIEDDPEEVQSEITESF
jgi:hypothetical protein